MKILVNLEDGEFGRAYNITEIKQIPFLVIRIAEIFSQLKNLIRPPMALSYCIEIESSHKKVSLEEIIIFIENKGLPGGTKFYSVNNQKVFEIKNHSIYCCYLIAEGVLQEQQV